MPFQVILATAPTEYLENVSLSLRFSMPSGVGGQAQMTFGQPSHIEGAVFDFSSGSLNRSVLTNFANTAKQFDKTAKPLDVHGTVHSVGEKVQFSLKNLSSNDTLHMLALSRQLFLGNVFHQAQGGVAELNNAPCVAMCADGTSGQGCVTCVHGGITVKICC